MTSSAWLQGDSPYYWDFQETRGLSCATDTPVQPPAGCPPAPSGRTSPSSFPPLRCRSLNEKEKDLFLHSPSRCQRVPGSCVEGRLQGVWDPPGCSGLSDNDRMCHTRHHTRCCSQRGDRSGSVRVRVRTRVSGQLPQPEGFRGRGHC